MKIEIHSVQSIEKRSRLPFLPNTALISIGDTGEEPPRLLNKPSHILRLHFDDMTLQEVREEYDWPESAALCDERLMAYMRERNIYLLSDEQARQMAAFILKHSGKTDVLLCQCRYGQSRSAGCAAAAAEYFYGNGIDIFADDSYYPNKLVYRKVIKALKACEAESK